MTHSEVFNFVAAENVGCISTLYRNIFLLTSDWDVILSCSYVWSVWNSQQL